MTRSPTRRWRALLLLLLSLCAPRAAHAHDIDSASLSLKEVAPGRFHMRFQASSRSLQQELAAPAVFPPPCKMADAYLECGSSGLVGSIEFPWLEGTLTRLMVDIEWRGGAHLLRIVSASAPELKVYGMPESGFLALKPIALDYTELGIEHILTGFDHLLFVIALAILVRSRRRLIATITAFTVAHSVTLAFTVLGVLRVPSAPVEATIALSIVLICAECLRQGESFTQRAPWLVAFAFGLLHGLGFASALLEIGLPEQHLPAALFCFNLGVELGQLAVIAAVLAVRALVTRLKWQRPWQVRVLVYAMGGIASFWSLDRIVAVFSG
ncbi:MAG TPA: HupE/UreJ family protein [Polyangiaceae bacterium]